MRAKLVNGYTLDSLPEGGVDIAVCGMSLAEADIRQRTGSLILAIRKASGEFNTNPRANTVLEAGDHLVVLGTQTQLDAVQNII